jgi:hypothetical protein
MKSKTRQKEPRVMNLENGYFVGDISMGKSYKKTQRNILE